MVSDRNIERVAQALLRASLAGDGSLTEERVLETIQAVAKIELSKKAEVLAAYRRLAEEELAKQRAVVTSAVEVSESERQVLETAIKRFHPNVRSVLWQTDAALIGGMTLLAADQWYDFSLDHQLATIKEQLSR